MKIEEKMYVRTKDYPHYRSKIGKIDGGSIGRWHLDCEEPHCIIGEDNILKSSFNIIDLIEVGDYINGGVVIDIHPSCIYVADRRNNHNGALLPTEVYQIETILTHEQFDSAKYEVK